MNARSVTGAVRVLWWAARGERAAVFVTGIGLAATVCITLALLALAHGLQTQLATLLHGSEHALRVTSARIHVNAIGQGALVPQQALSPRTLAELARIPGVDAVYAEAWARFPSVFRAELYGQRLASEGALLGIDPRAIPELRDRLRYVPGAPIPVVVPGNVLDLYNSGFAPAHALPRLDARLLRGVRFEIVAGSSVLSGDAAAAATARVYPARIVGSARHGDVVAALVPLDALDAMHAALGAADAPALRTAAVLRLRDDARVVDVERATRALGLRAEPLGGAIAQLQAAVRTATTVVGAVGAVLLLATVIVAAQANTLLLARRAHTVRALHAHGLRRGVLVLALPLEAGIAALLACALGAALGIALAHGLAATASEALRERIGWALAVVPRLPLDALAVMVLGVPAIVAAAAAAPVLRALRTHDEHGDVPAVPGIG